MPYGYYTFVRIVTAIVASVMAYKSFEQHKTEIACCWLGVAILFQPIIKIALGRVLWNVIDVALAVVFIVLIYKKYMNEKQ